MDARDVAKLHALTSFPALKDLGPHFEPGILDNVAVPLKDWKKSGLG